MTLQSWSIFELQLKAPEKKPGGDLSQTFTPKCRLFKHGAEARTYSQGSQRRASVIGGGLEVCVCGGGAGGQVSA